jgi:hypothetical protein
MAPNWQCDYYNRSGEIIDKKNPCPNGCRCYYAHPTDYEWDRARHVADAVRAPRWLAFVHPHGIIDYPGEKPVPKVPIESVYTRTALPKFKKCRIGSPPPTKAALTYEQFDTDFDDANFLQTDFDDANFLQQDASSSSAPFMYSSAAASSSSSAPLASSSSAHASSSSATFMYSSAAASSSSSAPLASSSSVQLTARSSAQSALHPLYAFDALGEWDDDHVLLLANTSHIPLSPDNIDKNPICVCRDGLWGHHEWTREPQLFDEDAMHLAFLPVPLSPYDQDPLFVMPMTTHWEAFPGKRDYIRLAAVAYEQLHTLALQRIEDFACALDCYNKLLQGTLPTAEVAAASSSNDQNATFKKIVEALKVPTVARTRMLLTLNHARRTGTRSPTESILLFRAHQRAAAELEAFVNMCWHLIPPSNQYLREKLAGHLRHIAHPRRGSIFVGNGSEKMYDFFRDKGVPVYTVVSKSDLPGSQPSPTSGTRCDVSPHIWIGKLIYVLHLTNAQ